MLEKMYTGGFVQRSHIIRDLPHTLPPPLGALRTLQLLYIMPRQPV